MKLHFPADIVRRLVAHAKASTEWSMGYDTKKKPAPGLFLVGDHGVYLMSNGVPGLSDAPDGKKQVVAYANGINPDVDPFDVWWEAKRAAFGGDDGAECLTLDFFEPWLATDSKTIPLNISPGRISVDRPKTADAAKVKVGTVVKFHEPIVLTNSKGSITADTFRAAERYGRSMIWSALSAKGEGGYTQIPGRYKIAGWDKRQFNIIETA